MLTRGVNEILCWLIFFLRNDVLCFLQSVCSLPFFLFLCEGREENVNVTLICLFDTQKKKITQRVTETVEQKGHKCYF